MSALKIIEHKSASYAPRTYYNAHTADLTIAVASNYFTGGERCTHKAAGEKYLALPIENPAVENARLLYKELKKRDVKILNVAGNGIYTLNKSGWNQAKVNQYLFDLLSVIQPHYQIEKVISGGQTGVDIAGAVAALALEIPAELCYPKGYRLRFEDGVDIESTEDYLFDWIFGQVEELNGG